jgi:hypothetical protein
VQWAASGQLQGSGCRIGSCGTLSDRVVRSPFDSDDAIFDPRATPEAKSCVARPAGRALI